MDSQKPNTPALIEWCRGQEADFRSVSQESAAEIYGAIATLLEQSLADRALLMTAYDLVAESIGSRQYDYEARAKWLVDETQRALGDEALRDAVDGVGHG